MYIPTFRTPSNAAEEIQMHVKSLNDDNASIQLDLKTIVELCQQMGCGADLYDEAGFRKGWVRSDGNYTLT